MMHTYRLLDLTPKGRNENGHGMRWVRHVCGGTDMVSNGTQTGPRIAIQ